MHRPAVARWENWLLGGWILAFSIVRAGRFQDTDPYWQVVAGREVLAGSPLARPDTWSWAPVGGLFYPNSPAWNVLLARAWDMAGSWGMFLLSGATIAAYLTMVAVLARRLGAGPLATIGAIIVTSLAALPMLSPRATMAAQLLVMAAIVFATSWAARAPRHRLSVNALVVGAVGFAFSASGNWIHLSWSTMALAVAVAWVALWSLWPGLPLAGRVAMGAAGTVGLVAGVPVGPYGMSVYERASVVLEVCRGLILEWSSAFTPGTAARWAIPAILAIAVAIWAAQWCVALARARGRTDPRLAIAASVITIGLPAALAGVMAIRFVGVALLTLAPLTALAISLGMGRLHARFSAPPSSGRSRASEYTSGATWRVLLTLLLVVLVPFAALYASPHSEPDTAEATRLLPANCRLFAQANESAAVILLRPDVPIWLDGRAEYWGRDRLEEMFRLLYAVDPDEPVPPGTTCVLLPPAESNPGVVGLTQALDESPDWARSATTRTAVVWVRQAG